MVGMKAGEEKDIHVTFPDNYQAENLKGQPVVFKIKLHEVKTKTLAELNDAWVETLNREEKTVTTLKEALKKELTDRKEKTAKQQFENDIITKVLEGVSVDIPESMITKEAQGQIEQIKNQAKQYNIPYEQFLQFSGMTPDRFEMQAKEDAASRVKLNVVFEAIAQAEQLEVTQEKIESEYQKLAETHKLELNYVKQVVTPEQLKKDLLPQLGYEFVIESAIKK
jgi:trigger factor